MRSTELVWPDARAAVREAAASDPAAAVTATPMPWERHLRAAALTSVAMAVPGRVVTNAEVAERAGVTEQWIVHRTGVHERRNVSEGERLQDLATAAGRDALDEAGIRPEDVDLVLVATLAADELTPNAAPLVAHDLGATNAGAMDVGAACTGFLSGLQLATAQVEGGRADNVLLIGADVLSRYIDPSRPRHRRAVRRRRRRRGGGAGRERRRPHRRDPAALRRHRRAGHHRRRPRAHHPHAGPRHLQGGGPPDVRGVRRGGRPRRPLTWPTSTCSSTTRRTRGSLPRSASGSASTRPASSTRSTATATPARPRSRSPSRTLASAGCSSRACTCCSRHSARASRGAQA